MGSQGKESCTGDKPGSGEEELTERVRQGSQDFFQGLCCNHLNPQAQTAQVRPTVHLAYRSLSPLGQRLPQNQCQLAKVRKGQRVCQRRVQGQELRNRGGEECQVALCGWSRWLFRPENVLPAESPEAVLGPRFRKLLGHGPEEEQSHHREGSLA